MLVMYTIRVLKWRIGLLSLALAVETKRAFDVAVTAWLAVRDEQGAEVLAADSAVADNGRTVLGFSGIFYFGSQRRQFGV